jgi:ribosome-associated translation inhibitor RaiA
MSSLTDAELSAMLERCEKATGTAHKVLDRMYKSHLTPAELKDYIPLETAVDIATIDLPAVIAELQAAREHEAALLAEGRLLIALTDFVGHFLDVNPRLAGMGPLRDAYDALDISHPLIAAEVERGTALEKVVEAELALRTTKADQLERFLEFQVTTTWEDESGDAEKYAAWVYAKNRVIEAKADLDDALAALDRKGE